MKNLLLVCLAALLVLAAMPVLAQGSENSSPPSGEITQEEIAAGLANDASLLDTLRTLGLLVFTKPFVKSEGLGDGPFDPTETPPMAFGHRPTLQGNGQHLRINGLDAQSCNECHNLVSHATEPPELGIGGAGGVAAAAMPGPTLVDVADSFDDRVQYVPGHDPDLSLEFDGVADYNGRFINPPFLFGGGGVELLAKEMTYDLQKILAAAKSSPAGTVLALKTHGVSFGHVTSLGGGNVELDVEGIGPEDTTGVPPEDVLVVRPFGRKGENFSMRDFDRGAMQFHFGVQPVEVVGENVDEDGDGVVNEVSVADMTVLHIFSVTNPRPFRAPLTSEAQNGSGIFKEIGCADCHKPELRTRTPWLPLAHPEVANDPNANVYAAINMVSVGFQPKGSGIAVPLYADLKRHKMGDALAETFESNSVANDEFTTARLWGIADSAPYLHDGRATTLEDAITMHGGDAEDARNNFVGLPQSDKDDLIAFLNSLRTPEHPNEDILP